VLEIFGYTISFDWSWVDRLGDQPFYYLLWYFFINGGWILFVLVIIWGLYLIFVYSRQMKFASKQNYIFLAIDIPKVNLQSPKAVENIFSVLAGAHMPLEWEEQVFNGVFQLGFSLEIISIDGYIQFIIRTPIHWRDLVESAIYSQYPDAEVTEVEDYTADLDIAFPSDEYNIWGSDLALTRDYWYPIRTYPDFEHSMSQELKDPLAALLEVMNKLGPGEQFWFQILLYPTGFTWMAAGEKALKKLIGQKVPEKKSFLDELIETPISWLNEFGNQLFGGAPAGEKKEEDRMYFLPPKENQQAEAINRKVSKIGFECKLRIVYFAKKEVFNKGLGVSGTIGAIKQFTDLNTNGFKPDKNKTNARWPWFKKRRLHYKQNRIFNAYKSRDAQTGSALYILNIEELATIFHFPYMETGGPLIKKIESKKAMAPIELPGEAIGLPVEEPTAADSVEKKEEEKIPVIDYDDDYFEERFAKDKTGKTDKKRKEKVVKKMKKAEAKKKVEAKLGIEQKFAKELETEPEKPKEEFPGNLPFVE